jgi:outer membrane receptor protein involved in Fe transport
VGLKFTIFIFLFSLNAALACPVDILIKDANGKSIAGATIIVDADTLGITKENGNLIASLTEGSHQIVLEKHGYRTRKENIIINCSTEDHFDFTLERSLKGTIDLQEVTVRSATAKELNAQTPFSVQTIDLSKSYDKGGDVSEILNRASGVKLRSDGSIGAPVQINLGGLQGKAVRLFKDGIPIELFGHGFSLGTIPVNMLERVEIYKGVMPLYLASDALGGGVNLVSRHATKNFAELSYEAGSFNTHRVTANGLWRNKNKTWYLGTSSSFNYSDNNYKVNAPITKGSTAYQNAKRFHDATRTHYTEGYAGIQNRTWADDLRLTLISSSFYKEIQNDAKMDAVYGQAFSRERNYTSLLNYKKNFWNERLKVNAVGTYSYFKTKFIDTATVRYDWAGHIIAHDQTPGEINLGNNQHIDYNFFSSRISASYQLSNQHIIDFSQLYHQQNRNGSDPLGAVSPIERIDVLTVPAVYRKNVTALGLRSAWFGKDIESIVAFKYYHFKTDGYTTDNSGTGFLASGSKKNLGYLGGVRWNRGAYLLKLSYEYATRLPDEYEVFGDARLVRENLRLNPERSHNINLNGEYRMQEGDRSFTLTGSVFYRKVKDGIFLQLDIPFNRYINYEQTEVKGIELEADYTPNKRFDLGANVTYQDIRRIDIKDPRFIYEEGSRVPNVPYFFSNIWLNTYFKDILKKGDRLELNWSANYTHRFFLYTIPKNQEPSLFGKVKDVQTSLIIPRDGRLGQLASNVGIYYHFVKPKLTISGECRNIGDVRLYDNFNEQKPGRAFFLKLVYQFL